MTAARKGPGPQHSPQGATYISDLAGRIERMLGDLRVLEGKMRTPPGPAEIEIPVMKAEGNLEAFEGWVAGVLRKYEREQKAIQRENRKAQLLSGKTRNRK